MSIMAMRMPIGDSFNRKHADLCKMDQHTEKKELVWRIWHRQFEWLSTMERSIWMLKIFLDRDVGPPLGGVFTATQGLKTTFNTPLDERGIVGMATGIAMTGDRCVAEIQFVDYIFNTIDMLKIIGNTHWCSNGQIHLPLVLMTPVGAEEYAVLFITVTVLMLGRLGSKGGRL